jgi:hypothetical protein
MRHCGTSRWQVMRTPASWPRMIGPLRGSSPLHVPCRWRRRTLRPFQEHKRREPLLEPGPRRVAAALPRCGRAARLGRKLRPRVLRKVYTPHILEARAAKTTDRASSGSIRGHSAAWVMMMVLNIIIFIIFIIIFPRARQLQMLQGAALGSAVARCAVVQALARGCERIWRPAGIRGCKQWQHQHQHHSPH